MTDTNRESQLPNKPKRWETTCPACGSAYGGTTSDQHTMWKCGTHLGPHPGLYRSVGCKRSTGDLAGSGGVSCA